MKLKQVVGSLFLLGLVSSPAFAAPVASNDMPLDPLRSQVARMESAMQEDQAGGLYLRECNDWWKRITVSGQANVDAATANRSPVFWNENGSVSDLWLDSALLFIDGQLSDWAHGHIGLAYGTNSPNFVRVRPGNSQQGHTGGSSVANSLLDEAYISINQFSKNPFFFQAGKQRVRFGDYKPFADITPSLTQLLSETRAVTATVGFSHCTGLNGSIYAFRGANVQADSTESNDGLSRIKNYGGSLGYAMETEDWGFKAGVQYLSNMVDVDYISQTLVAATPLGVSNLAFGNYAKRVGGVAANIGGRYGMFDASAKYVGSVRAFDPTDIAFTDDFGQTATGAKVKAWGVDVGVSFPTMGHESRFGLGYQGSNQAGLVGAADNSLSNVPLFLSTGLPQDRYLAEYAVNLTRNTDLGFQYRQDVSYSSNQRPIVSSDGDIDNGKLRANVGTVRLSVKFA